MSKKRKTRKEKERAIKHREQILVHVDLPSYSIPKAPKDENKQLSSSVEGTVPDVSVAQNLRPEKSKSYLKRDIFLIASASGIVIAFDALLFTLLTRGIIKLPLFGY